MRLPARPYLHAALLLVLSGFSRTSQHHTMTLTRFSNIAFVILFASHAFAEDLPSLEAYGRLPTYDLFELSPSGDLAAGRMRLQDKDLITVVAVDDVKLLVGASAEKVRPRQIKFVEEDKVILVAGQTVRSGQVRGGSFYYSHAYSLDVNDGEIQELMKRARDVYTFQGRIGRIIGKDPESKIVYMPAFVDSHSPALGVYAVSLDDRREKLVVRGNKHTTDWFLDADGKPIVREDFDDKNNIHQIWRVDEKGRNDKLLYEKETILPSFGTVGMTPDRDSLVILKSSRSAGARAYYLLSLEHGELTGPVLVGDGRDIRNVVTDFDRVVYGVEYAGFTPTYTFFDKELSGRVAELQRRLQGVSSRLISWSADFKRLLFEIEGGWTSGAFLVFEKGVSKPWLLGRSRAEISKEFVAPVEITQYEARDGRSIPALVTSREDVRDAGNAPLIVMPHGGPRSHDKFGFDWFAQYFASRGYVVLQPQYRGSNGFGHEHMVAGTGEYGGKMLSDIDDGVRHLIDVGLADPERVCSVGASYGGYAALAAGAFSSDMYRCIVSIAGVSDIPKKMSRAKRTRGSDDWGIDYWEKFYGAEVTETEFLQSISPAYHAESFQVPVLLLHGVRDTSVNIGQSTRMYKALRKAGKDVTFIKLQGEDHWLTQEETRIEALQATAEFIERHL